MNPRWRQWLFIGLAAAVLVAAVFLPLLRRSVKRSARLQVQSEEQARRELLHPTIVNSSEPRVKTSLFWASPEQDGALAAVSVQMPLSNDPVLRAKQVLDTLLAGPVDADLRTLPPDAALLEFYLLPDGTGVADFSDPMATSLPSGIESEQMAVDSIARTLEANVPQVQRLKILIHGQEAETLAGHVDLTGTFVVNTKGAVASAAVAPEMLTPTSAPGKLSQPERKP
ncbi:MAG: hypothetical protein DMG33_09530 [Acidobacteria bacterium]|nr:MAG: hypothetical protein DMG33_09530 [Acidobacteriota bacterium]